MTARDWKEGGSRAHQLPLTEYRVTADAYFRPHYVSPRLRAGMALGGGHGLGIAQARCPWWIEGMLRLLVAIDTAKDVPQEKPGVGKGGKDA